MARSKSDAAKKAGGKAPRKVPVLQPASTSKSGVVSKRKSTAGGRNSECKRPVPEWQVPISKFLTKEQLTLEAAAGAPPADAEVIDMEPAVGPSTSSADFESAGPQLAEIGSTPEFQKDDESINSDNANEEKDTDIVGEGSGQNSGIEKEIAKEDVKDYADEKNPAAASEEVTEIPETMPNELDEGETPEVKDTE